MLELTLDEYDAVLMAIEWALDQEHDSPDSYFEEVFERPNMEADLISAMEKLGRAWEAQQET